MNLMIETTRHNIRILVAERIDLVRMGLRMLFENHPVITLIEETDNIADLSALTARHRPDVILMDVGLGGDDCAEHVSRLLNICPHSKILLFSSFQSDYSQLHTLPAGVAGIISKHSPCKLLVAAICAIHSDQRCLETSNPIFPAAPKSPEQTATQPTLPCEISASFHPELSNNERRVAYLAGKGLSAREISQQLLLSEKTVRNYLSAIYKKMGIKKQIELCLRAPSHNYFQE